MCVSSSAVRLRRVESWKAYKGKMVIIREVVFSELSLVGRFGNGMGEVKQRE